MYGKKSNLKILITSARLVKKINKGIFYGGEYPNWVDIRYPDQRVVFYTYKLCKRLGYLLYRRNIISWNTKA